VVLHRLLGHHNLWLGSIGGTLIEGSFLIVNGLNIIASAGCKSAVSIRLKLKTRGRREPLAR
jgi:hypothetical protein